MSIQLNDEEIRAHLSRIVAATTEKERHAAADSLVVDLRDKEALEQWGRFLASRYGRQQDWEDFTSVITEALLLHARSLTAEELAKVKTVAAYLYYRGRAAVQKWLDSPAVTFAAEMSGVSRRHRMARAAIKEMRTNFGREPETSEVVDYVNTRALANRANAVKQGALISADDVDGVMLRPYSMDYTSSDSEAPDSFGTPDDGNVTITAEVALTITQLGARARTMFGADEGVLVTQTLRVWADLVLAKEQITPTVISRQLGIGRRTAMLRLQQVDAVLTAFREAHGD